MTLIESRESAQKHNKKVFLTPILKEPIEGSVTVDENGNQTGIPFNPLRVKNDNDRTAFGELSVAELSPVVQLQFPYNINTDQIEIRNNNGASSVVDNMANLSTGAGANQSSTILSKTPIKYNSGQGGLVRGSPKYTLGVANSTQYWGIGNSTDGYFFGYNGTEFGILRRQGGLPEVRRLAITTASNTNEDITINLNGVAEIVAVTAAGADDAATRVTTANEIAAHDFSNVGAGWEVHNMGANIFFTSYADGADKTSTYSLVNGGGEAVGAFTRPLAGVAAIETIIKQTDWNHDRLSPANVGIPDNNNPSGMTLDPTKGNVYQIRYQWLGFGAQDFFIENSITGVFVLVHKIQYTNLNTFPSVNNPTLPLCVSVKNGSNTSDVVMQIGSMGGFIEGRDELAGLSHSIVNTVTGISNTEVPIMTIHSHDIYQGTINRVKIKIISSNVSIEGNKTSIVRLRKNAMLTGPVSFSPLNSNTSTIHVDTSATGVSGGIVIGSSGAGKIDRILADLEKVNLTLVAPEFFTLTVQGTAVTSIEAVGAFNWQELF